MHRGCETWIVREGYEGLVRGNAEHSANASANSSDSGSDKGLDTAIEAQVSDPSLIHNLRFGDGELLKDGTGDLEGGRTLKGRYIVRVGWDDVRGWFAEVAST